MKQLTWNVPCFADSFLNWRIYWLALAWLIEETVRYGILFWWVEGCSHLQIMLVWSKGGSYENLECETSAMQ